MGQAQSQRQDDYAIEGSSNEPVIIREVSLGSSAVREFS